MYLTLFTCASSRAVHLDLVPELSTQAFIRCFHRFTARRGIPREMISDNALTFKAASGHIARVLTRSQEILEFKTDYIEVQSCKSPVVGWVLRAYDQMCEEMFEEDTWYGEVEL